MPDGDFILRWTSQSQPGEHTYVDVAPTDVAMAQNIQTPSATQVALDSRYSATELMARLMAPGLYKSPIVSRVPVTVKRFAGAYTTDINPLDYHTEGTGPTYYVDPVFGSNTNTGLSWAQAFKTPQYATLKNASDASRIIVRGGIHLRVDAPVFRSQRLRLEAEPGTRPIFTQCDQPTGWAPRGSGAYTVALATVSGVIDRATLDTDGDPYFLKQAASIAVCDATPGTWILSAGTLYSHLPDSRAPDLNVLVSRTTNTMAWSTFTGAPSLYLEGVEFWGGSTANLTPPAIAGSKLLAKNTAWKFCNPANGLSVIGVETVVLRGCEASKNALDGFNYHASTSGLSGQVVEIDCVGIGNGINPGSNNGSTSHENYQVVRVAGRYLRNAGANVAEVNNAKSWNVGVFAADSVGYSQDFYTDAEMWLIGCLSAGSAQSAVAAGTGKLHITDSLLPGAIVGTVTV